VSDIGPEQGHLALTEKQREDVLQRQLVQWPRAIKEGKGNRYATLCFHCYGRHPPPRDEICPHDPPPRRDPQ
jgi:hypothetical protein